MRAGGGLTRADTLKLHSSLAQERGRTNASLSAFLWRARSNPERRPGVSFGKSGIANRFATRNYRPARDAAESPSGACERSPFQGPPRPSDPPLFPEKQEPPTGSRSRRRRTSFAGRPPGRDAGIAAMPWANSTWHSPSRTNPMSGPCHLVLASICDMARVYCRDMRLMHADWNIVFRGSPGLWHEAHPHRLEHDFIQTSTPGRHIFVDGFWDVFFIPILEHGRDPRCLARSIPIAKRASHGMSDSPRGRFHI